MACIFIGVDADDHSARNDHSRVDDASIQICARSDDNPRSQNRPMDFGVRMNAATRTDDAMVELTAD